MTPGPFAFAVPTRLVFGLGCRASTGAEAAVFGPRVALVTGGSFERNPAAATVEASLAAAAVAVVLRIQADREPDDAMVLMAAERIAAADPSAIVAVGGGSVLDLAKAAAAVAREPDRLARLMAGERLELPGPYPVVALPTTGGSGAEISHAAIVLDRGAGRKRGVRGPGVAARVALVDPELARSAGAAVTAAAGFDAIAHAIETAVSKAASPLTLNLSADALGRLLEFVPAACRDPDDLDARAQAAYAAALMGMNLATSTTCLPHRLQYPLGALTGTGHAQGVAALFPAWLERTAAIVPEQLAGLAVGAGLVPPGTSDASAARTLVTRVGAHLETTGMRAGIADLGIDERSIPGLVGAVEGTLTNDPGPVGPEDLEALYRASLQVA